MIFDTAEKMEIGYKEPPKPHYRSEAPKVAQINQIQQQKQYFFDTAEKMEIGHKEPLKSPRPLRATKSSPKFNNKNTNF